jgi:putative SOS response-associated peptidase YedK
MIEDISEEEFQERFGLEEPYKPEPRYNVAPTQEMPVVVAGEKRHVEIMKWGLIPRWQGSGKGNYSMINARAETVALKPYFKKSLLFHRCIVPASGFYEWKKLSYGKVPYYFRLKNVNVFGFAGLYDAWRDDKGHDVKSYTIITTQPNKAVKPVHDRMPVILKAEDQDRWLDSDVVEPERLTPLLVPFPDNLMDSYPIGTLVNSPKNDSRELIEPLPLGASLE